MFYIVFFLIPLILLVLAVKFRRSPTTKGGILGLVIFSVIWLVDHDFLLNAGGPEAPISRYLHKIIGLDEILVLPALGLLIGLLFGLSVSLINRNRKL